MKKIIVLIALVISILSAYKVDAYVQRDFLIDWVCINIDIPINENFANYENSYIVNVYVDGRQLTSAEYYCRLNQNGTSTSTVNTSKVGTYRIGARVELYDYNASSETYITYNVVDKEAPEIFVTQDSITTSYNNVPNYSKYFTATDNSNEIISVTVSDDVKYNVLGVQNIILYATDKAGNTSEYPIKLYVVDTVSPTLEVLKPIVVSLGEDIVLSEFFKSNDVCEGDLTNFVELENFDSTKLGEQYVYAVVYDSSENETRLRVKITVVDDIAPVIEFNTNDARIDINEDITYDKMKSFIRTVTDNSTSMNIDDVRIDFSSVFNELGSYTVYYSAVDYVGNEGVYTLTVRVVQMEGPVITCKDIVVAKGEIFQDSLVKNYITVYDAYDTTAASTLKIDMSGVNLGSSGIYFVVVSACNSSGVFTYETLTITVEGNSISSILNSTPTVIVTIVIVLLIPIGGLCYFGYTKIQKDKLKKFE